MPFAIRLAAGETLADRILKVDHAGENGAVAIYSAQRLLARWRAPEMLDEIDHFIEHEKSHRARFGAELARRSRPRCRTFHLCGLGGLVLGAVTGLLGAGAIAATTVAIERVVLSHMKDQIAQLQSTDPAATSLLLQIIQEEQEHHDLSARRLVEGGFWSRLIDPVVSASTEAVIWLGMRIY